MTDKAVTIILGIIVASVFAVGVSNVYGDTYTELIEIPIPDNITGMESKKQLTTLDDNILEYTITLRFFLGENGTKWFEEELTDVGITPPDVTLCPDRFYLDEDGVTCYPIIENPILIEDFQETPSVFDTFVKDLERFEKDPPTKPSEIDYYEQLKYLQMCYRVTEQNQQSLGVTQNDGFAVSNLWIEEFGHLLKSFQLTGNPAILEKAIEECKYIHTILNPVTFGVEYQNRAKYFNSTQVYHGDLAEDIPTWSQQRVNEEANRQNEPSDKHPICEDSSYYSESTKRMYCGDDFVARTESVLTDERKVAMCNSAYVMPGFKLANGCTVEQVNIPCYACQQSDPTIESDALSRYADYLNNGDESQKTLMKQQMIRNTLNQVYGK
jgi:hypothetical protein